MNFVYIFLGGGIGSIIRYIISNRFNYSDPSDNYWPIGTLIINIFSCLVLGYFYKYFIDKTTISNSYFLVIVGLCGGMSTFSTFVYELFQFSAKGQLSIGIIYVLTSLVTGCLALYLGIEKL